MKPYYEEAGIQIFHADCLDILPGVEADLLLTDPPYGLGAARCSFGGAGISRRKTEFAKIERRDYGDADWDDEPVDAELLQLAVSRCPSQIIWGGNYFDLGPARCYLVWDKLRGDTDYADAELAWTNLDRPVRVIRWKWNGFLQQNSGRAKEERWHPTQKPFSVMSWALAQVAGVATVLDPWLGSGTTLVAVKAAGIAGIGIEIKEKYCEIAANRLRQDILPFEGPAKHTDDFGRLLGWQDSLIDEALERAEKPCDGNPT